MKALLKTSISTYCTMVLNTVNLFIWPLQGYKIFYFVYQVTKSSSQKTFYRVQNMINSVKKLLLVTSHHHEHCHIRCQKQPLINNIFLFKQNQRSPKKVLQSGVQHPAKGISQNPFKFSVSEQSKGRTLQHKCKCYYRAFLKVSFIMCMKV